MDWLSRGIRLILFSFVVLTTYVVNAALTHSFLLPCSSPGILLPKRVALTVVHEGQHLDKGFNLLELAGGVIPQSLLVQSAKAGWKFAWQRMMAELAPQDPSGSYVRPSYSVNGPSQLASDLDRFHLLVGNPCPWCHRTLLTVNVLRLDASLVGVTRLVDNPEKASRGGWIFSPTDPDPIFKSRDLRELYERLSPGGKYQGRCTAPLLMDKKQRCIVSNESSTIVRLLNGLGKSRQHDIHSQSSQLDLYPKHLSQEIDSVNEWVYALLNNGVYRCGFSTSQSAYDQASQDVRFGLARCETILSKHSYMCGESLTEADIRLLPTILRFDGAYAPLFRAGGAHIRIRTYPALHAWLVRCWQQPGVKESIDISDACRSYFAQLFPLNPGGLVPSPVTASDLGLESKQSQSNY